MSDSRYEILLVEDNPGDVLLTREAFREGKFPNHLSVVRDGDEAIEFLKHEGKYGDAPRPDLILLDLNLPKKDGRELLRDIKSDHELRNIPVIVLTVSKADEDIDAAYDLHANCYLTKPLHIDQFMRTIRSLEAFWLNIVKLPNHS